MVGVEGGGRRQRPRAMPEAVSANTKHSVGLREAEREDGVLDGSEAV